MSQFLQHYLINNLSFPHVFVMPPLSYIDFSYIHEHDSEKH